MEPITCSTICADDDGLHELDQGAKVVSIPWEEIEGVELGLTLRSERPVLQTISSIGLIVLGFFGGLYPLWKQLLILNTASGPYPPGRGLALVGAMACFIPVGVYLLFSTLQKRHCLKIKLKKGKRKLFFNDPITFQEASFFLIRLDGSRKT